MFTYKHNATRLLISLSFIFSSLVFLFPDVSDAAGQTSKAEFELIEIPEGGDGFELKANEMFFESREIQKTGNNNTKQSNILNLEVNNFSGRDNQWIVSVSLGDFIGQKTGKKLVYAKIIFMPTLVKPVSQFDPDIIDQIKPQTLKVEMTPNSAEQELFRTKTRVTGEGGYGHWQATYGTPEKVGNDEARPVTLIYGAGNLADTYISTITYTLKETPTITDI
ncbi:WxL domain-containing protein [Vagococcus silagei]|nr:WxL domain-containing protein [Vagococcus silagei]